MKSDLSLISSIRRKPSTTGFGDDRDRHLYGRSNRTDRPGTPIRWFSILVLALVMVSPMASAPVFGQAIMSRIPQFESPADRAIKGYSPESTLRFYESDASEDGKANVYGSSAGEIIFSWANVDDRGYENGSVVRFTPFFNLQVYVNVDPTPYLGFFAGLAVHNVGFIYDQRDSVNMKTKTRKKYRSYELGFPVGFKIGDMDGILFYAGYEPKFPFSYKEKTFVNEVKEDKFLIWFSERTPIYTHAVFGGVDLAGFNIKFKYYLKDFFDPGYLELDDQGKTIQPYADFNARLFYISVCFSPFRSWKRSFGRSSRTSVKTS